MFQVVTEENIEEAALIHLLSWQESHHNLIENLYVLPDQQRKGYGELLLKYAKEQCEGTPTLWILSNNDRARAFYLKNGFDFTGERKELKGGLAELEMKFQKGVW